MSTKKETICVWSILFIFLVLFISAIQWPWVYGQTSSVVPISTTGTATWTHSGKDIDGKTDSLGNVELVLVPFGLNPNITGTATRSMLTPGKVGENSVPITDLVKGLTGRYDLWARQFDTSGNKADFVGPVPLEIDTTKPAPITGLSVPVIPPVTITITISGGGGGTP